ncbi:1576_t:CDS:2 [Ambispora gerdemannii]|uniref:1576_t:CDS:1 n=1 Tax=Ambispora gerdemannii TaxID=144530 RepID=A0A9N8VXI9_9GLOM|nr:1576_t:CDS:2 [Ambispora gerdemannii]
MNFQSIILFLAASLAFVVYAQAGTCTIFYSGATRHQTGNTSGCYGIDESDIVNDARTDVKGTCYTFYSDYGCKGSIVGQRWCDTSKPGIKGKSVKLECP